MQNQIKDFKKDFEAKSKEERLKISQAFLEHKKLSTSEEYQSEISGMRSSIFNGLKHFQFRQGGSSNVIDYGSSPQTTMEGTKQMTSEGKDYFHMAHGSNQTSHFIPSPTSHSREGFLATAQAQNIED